MTFETTINHTSIKRKVMSCDIMSYYNKKKKKQRKPYAFAIINALFLDKACSPFSPIISMAKHNFVITKSLS